MNGCSNESPAEDLPYSVVSSAFIAPHVEYAKMSTVLLSPQKLYDTSYTANDLPTPNPLELQL